MIEKLKQLLKEKNLSLNLDKIALNKDSQCDYYNVICNYMGTGIHIDANQVDEEQCKEEGITVWHTWTFAPKE